MKKNEKKECNEINITKEGQEKEAGLGPEHGQRWALLVLT
jgi:hypothetical protein